MDPQTPQQLPQDDRAPTGTPQASYYNAVTLSYYDIHVLGHNMGQLWRCPTKQHLLPLFQAHFWNHYPLTQTQEQAYNQARLWEHLDIGAGTGYFVAKALEERLTRDSEAPQQPLLITLMDVNQSTLKKSKRRIDAILHKFGISQQVRTAALHRDVLQPIPPKGLKKHDVVTMFNLLHCLRTPTPQDKNRAFEYAANSLRDDGVLVGCTILPGREYQSGLSGIRARYTLWLYNRVYKVFGNEGDSREQLEQGLRASFEEVLVDVVGSMMLFVAKKPRRAQS
ncbi:hypothetical protein QBC40DRAFT_262717 [Triangularia verruculosa]|uniref:Methyltransferase type 12 domain-containing protein n=1 Tax=Triangularia verruculosa TaxID=2587418 RepID=A0AAN7AYH4_9PEZI|nr:hypothetical protein QBC40DRAFT_262717 [Triangularia verruculosa]